LNQNTIALDGETMVASITRPDGRDRQILRDAGRALRETVPPEAHADWSPGKRDPLGILERQETRRVPELVPLRHSRMAANPFSFFRGGAAIMAADLATTPATGAHVQACGDAHLANFGLYASPERRLVFDVNDFDETLPAPWEWDLKRLAASVVLAGRPLGFDAELRRTVVAQATRAYTAFLDELTRRSTLDVWYSDIDAEEIGARIDTESARRAAARVVRKAREHTALRALDKLTEIRDGRRVIVDSPPVVQHLPDIELSDVLAFMQGYAETLPADRAHLLDQFELIDGARKVVGVGSVGTECFILVGQGRASLDPLVLQVKQAEDSVLSAFVGKSAYPHQGRRVVEGQHLMQATSDPFLGWSSGPDEKHYYIRQLYDMKASADFARMDAHDLAGYAQLCAETLARAHARSLDPALLAGYCGKGKKLAAAITRFAEAYADQAERDHAEFVEAISAPGDAPAP
jgi:uncharacterized protein (DUF2252 family)